MDATLTSNIITVIIVSVVLSVLINDDATSPAPVIKNDTLDPLTTQRIFRQCGNSPESNAVCVKLLDDLVQGVITKDEFLNYIKHSGVDKYTPEVSSANSL